MTFPKIFCKWRPWATKVVGNDQTSMSLIFVVRQVTGKAQLQWLDNVIR